MLSFVFYSSLKYYDPVRNILFYVGPTPSSQSQTPPPTIKPIALGTCGVKDINMIPVLIATSGLSN